jgi:cytochrome c peroxidase
LSPRNLRTSLERLFNEPALSADGTISCASCHSAQAAFAAPRPKSIGVYGKMGTRNAPTLWNVGYIDHLAWDGKAATLEEQAEHALLNPNEMALSKEQIAAREEPRCPSSRA